MLEVKKEDDEVRKERKNKKIYKIKIRRKYGNWRKEENS